MNRKLINILSIVIVLIIAIFFVVVFTDRPEKDESANNSTQNVAGNINDTTNSTEISTETEKEIFTTAPEGYFKDALFIGDSRTVGLSEYGGLNDADYFSSVGMNVYKINSEKVSVKGVGRLTLSELLSTKKYGKIYIMLGINELGYNKDTTAEKFSELIDSINKLQPNVIIYIQSNIHVGKALSDRDKVFKNEYIDILNDKLAALANNKTVFYLNINTAFDDEDGNLDKQYTNDNVHLLGKYYVLWSDFLIQNAVVK